MESKFIYTNEIDCILNIENIQNEGKNIKNNNRNHHGE